MDSLCEAASLNQGSSHRPALPLPHPGLTGSPRGRTGAGTQSFCPLPRPLIAGDRTGWGKEGGHYRLSGHAATRTGAPPILPSKGGLLDTHADRARKTSARPRQTESTVYLENHSHAPGTQNQRHPFISI